MANRTVRWAMASALALAAASAGQPQAVNAAPKSGVAKYSGQWPYSGAATNWDISVSPSGGVSGSYMHSVDVTFTPQHGGGSSFRVKFTYTGTMSGSLTGGVLTISGTQTRAASSKENDSPNYNYSGSSDFAYTATVVPDADGGLQGTANTGEIFVWYRR